MTEPTDLPIWDENGENLVEITEDQQNEGFPLKNKPASGTFNSWFRNVYKWVAWFQEKFSLVDAEIGKLAPVDTIADLKAITYTPEDGQVVNVLGYYAASENRDWRFKWDSSDLSAKVADDQLYGVYVALDSDSTGASGAWVRLYAHGYFDARWFGAKFDGSWDDAPAVQEAVDYCGNNGSVELSGRPVLKSTITFPLTGLGIRVFSKKLTTVRCLHNGDGFVLSATNYQYGSHILENLILIGPNMSYPTTGYVPVSTGAGIVLEDSYDNTFINVSSSNFKYGLRLRTGFSNKTIGNCFFLFNQIGIFIDGGISNVNKFENCKIRENREQGVKIVGDVGGPYPTKNSFRGSYIETNISYFSGYPSGGPGDGSASTGVWLQRTYENDFSDCYFENQEYDIWLTSSSSGNSCRNAWHAPGGGNTRLGKIMFDGAGVNDNVFTENTMLSFDKTTANVESNNASQSGNQFLDCRGFNFIAASLTTKPYVRNNSALSLVYGTQDGTLNYPAYGYLINPSEGTTRGTISGIGTATATLNASGLSEVAFANTITGATTIQNISNLKPHQMFTLWNYQEVHTVTIESTTKTGFIVLNGLRDAQFTKYGQCIHFLVNGQGKLLEIGRNFSIDQVGTVVISGTASSAIVTLPIVEKDYSYKAFATIGTNTGTPTTGSTRISKVDQGLASITIFLEAAPGAGNTVSINWRVVRNY